MRGSFSGPAGGHDKFFATFAVLGSALGNLDQAPRLVELLRRARLENIQYLELQAGPAMDTLEQVRTAALATDTPEEISRRLKPQIDAYIAAAAKELDRWEREVADKLGPGPRADVRYLISAYRLDSDARVMATWAAAFEQMKVDRRVVGVNLLGPEDHPLSQDGFERQMRILDGLWRQH